MNEIKKKKCIVCLGEYDYNSERAKTTRLRTVRSKNAYTCSKNCSKTYSRIYHRIIERINKKFKNGN